MYTPLNKYTLILYWQIQLYCCIIITKNRELAYERAESICGHLDLKPDMYNVGVGINASIKTVVPYNRT